MIQLVLADASEEFLVEVQAMLQDTCGALALEIISDPAYLETYLEASRPMDLLILSEAFYQKLTKRGAIDKLQLPPERVLLLSKSGDAPEALAHGVRVPRQQISLLPPLIRKQFQALEKTAIARSKTQLLVVHSPLGRCGRTSIAMGMAQRLAQTGARTLFLSLDRLQSCNWLLGENRYLLNDHLHVFTTENEDIAADVKRLVRRHGFFYLPPFSEPSRALRISPAVYLHLAKKLVAAEAYDAIVLDASCEFTETTAALLREADLAVIIAMQDADAVNKLNRMLLCLEDPFQPRFRYLCNLYRENMPDARPAHLQKLTAECCLPYLPQIEGSQVNRFAAEPSVAALLTKLTEGVAS